MHGVAWDDTTIQRLDVVEVIGLLPSWPFWESTKQSLKYAEMLCPYPGRSAFVLT